MATAHPSLDDPNAWVPYRYHPSLAAAALFAALFGLATITHCILLGTRRTWYFTPFIIGGCCKSPSPTPSLVSTPNPGFPVRVEQ